MPPGRGFTRLPFLLERTEMMTAFLLLVRFYMLLFWVYSGGWLFGTF